MRSKLYGGIGLAVCHSRPRESHGLGGAFSGLMNIDHIRNAIPRQNAAIDEKSLRPWRFFAYVNTRRGWPKSPMMNIGKNVRLKKTNIVQKWIMPSLRFIILPVILGSQKYRPAMKANSSPPMMV